MSIFEFDEEREMKIIRADERELGREEGHRNGVNDSVKLLIRYALKNNFSSEVIIQKVVEVFGLEASEVSLMIQSITA